MAYSDPQNITIGTTPGAVTLPRVNNSNGTGKFQNYDAKSELLVGTTYGKRTRRTARVNFSKVTADPLVSSTNVLVGASVYLVVDVPQSGFSAGDQKDLVLSLTNWLTANTNANLIKLVAGEN